MKTAELRIDTIFIGFRSIRKMQNKLICTAKILLKSLILVIFIIPLSFLEAETYEDYLNAYEALVPKLNYKHPHNPGHFGNHLMTTTLGSSLFIPVQSASMVLGAWQKVALIEFDGPSERHVTLSFIKITS